MPRPRSLTTAQLAGAALAVLDASGPAGLTMRTVATALGMSTMGLYRYVRDRDDLERLVVAHLFDAVDATPPPADLPWHERVATLLERVRAAFEAHPAVVSLTLVHRHRTPGVLRWAESLLAVLTEAGFDERERLIAVRALFGYLIGAIQLEHLGPLAGSGTRGLADLPAADFPHIAANVRHAPGLGPAEEFAGGLRILLRGMGPAV
jgi:AcrR family transcriptional regulator